MGRIVVTNNVSLDGVMQAPARQDEDPRGNFTQGGWAIRYQDEVLAAEMAKNMTKPGALLFGRRTYEDFYQVWPNRGDNPYTEVLNRTRKYVVSTTLTDPLPWQNSTLIADDPIETIRTLKKDDGGDLTILGSGKLIRALIPHGLIDAYVLIIHPLLLGSGQRLFPETENPTPLRLVKSVPTTTGTLIATYEPTPYN